MYICTGQLDGVKGRENGEKSTYSQESEEKSEIEESYELLQVWWFSWACAICFSSEIEPRAAAGVVV
jgi:hypothetical protein